MICRRCLQQRLAARRTTSSLHVSSRAFSDSACNRATAVTAQTTTATDSSSNDKPAATSTSAAQPLFTPPTLGPDNIDPPINTKQSTKLSTIRSSVPGGTVLRGLNFMKQLQDPIALEDSEYPAWLWDVLKEKSDAAGSQGNAGEGDLFSKSKKQRRIAGKALRKQQLLNPDALAPKVPLYEQSIDLPSGDGSIRGAMEAGAARQELTKAMRDKRRSKIKEDNFLKEMR